MDSLTDTLWTIGLASIGRGLEKPVKGLESPVSGNSEAMGFPNRSTFNAMHHLNNGGVVLSTAAHDIQDDNNEKRSYS
jgi:hypothetical protein